MQFSDNLENTTFKYFTFMKYFEKYFVPTIVGFWLITKIHKAQFFRLIYFQLCNNQFAIFSKIKVE